MHVRIPLLAFLLLCCKSVVHSQPKYVEAAQQLGVNFYYGSNQPAGGISFADFNQDGWDDLTIASDRAESIGFFVNEEGTFRKIEPPLVENQSEAKQVLWIDYDNDGDLDLFVTGHRASNRLYENTGDLKLVDVTVDAGLPTEQTPNFGATWGDFDRDGWLDLFYNLRPYVGYEIGSTNRLFRNLGNGTFRDVTAEYQLLLPEKAPFCASFIDVNNDLWPDIYVAEDKLTGNMMYKNIGGRTYADISERSQTDLKMFSMSVTTGDYDGDDLEDIYITNIDGSKLLRNTGLELFEELARESDSEFRGGYGWGSNFLDFDNDGDLDLYVSGMYQGTEVPSSQFYINAGQGKFTVGQTGFAGDTVISFANAFGDVNNDGFPDIAVNNALPYKTQVWTNSAVSGEHFVKIQLRGRLSNTFAVGSRVEVYAGSGRQVLFTKTARGFLAQNSGTLHFGLGEALQADSVRVFWPSGHTELFGPLIAGQAHLLQEGSKKAFLPRIKPGAGELVICGGDSVLLEAGLYGRDLTYKWSTGETTSTIWVKKGGEYHIEVSGEAAGGTLVSEPVVIQESATSRPLVNAEVSAVSCNGKSDGRILVNDIGADGFEWSHGAETLSLENLAPGIYTLSVGSGTCKTQRSFLVAEPDELLVEATFAHPHPGGNDGAIEAAVYGGTGPYEYRWEGNSPAAGSSLESLAAGQYTCTVTDANGCETQASFELTEADAILSADSAPDSILTIFPNPATSVVFIKRGKGMKGRLNYVVAGMDGAVYFSGRLTEGQGINIRSLRPGTYVIKVSSGKQQYSVRFIKK